MTPGLVDNGVTVNTPAEGGIVTVTIICDADEEVVATTTTVAPTTTTVAPTTTATGGTATTVAPSATTAPTTTTRVTAEVQGQVELPASPAQPQTGTPTFTG